MASSGVVHVMRRRLVGAVGLAVCVMLAVAASGVLASVQRARAHDAAGLIASPRPDSNAIGPVTVSIRAGDEYLPGAVHVTLNGRDISSYFALPHSGLRTAQVSPTQGLRYGLNVVTASAVPQIGPRLSQIVRFYVPRALPLAAAGPDVRVAVGTPVILDGSQSIPRSFGSPLNRAWRLVSKPAGSRARLTGTGMVHPVITPDKLGAYTVQLKVSDGTLSRSDDANVTAVYDSAEVPIDTAVDGVGPGGKRLQGIAIGYHPALDGYRGPRGAEQFYALPAGDAAQMVVVQRQTLAPVFSYAWPAGGLLNGFIKAGLKLAAQKTCGSNNQSCCGSGMTACLVIVTTWPTASWAVGGAGYVLGQVTGSGGGLSKIGAAAVSSADAAAGMTMEKSTLSWIGVEGFPEGGDWECAGGGNYGSTTSPGLDGYLALDPAGNYTYIANAGVPFDLGPDSPTTAKMTVGQATYTATLPAGSMGGFAVMVLHAGTLAPYNYDEPSQPGSSQPVVFSTRNADGSPNYGAGGNTYTGQGGFTGMSLYLERIQYQKIPEPVIVLIRSIGSPFTEEGLQPENNYKGSYDVALALAVDRLAFDVASLGGHYEWLIRLATPVSNAHQSYSEVGRNHTAEGDITTADTGTGVIPAVPATELSGQLERNNKSLFAPVETSFSPSIPNPLLPVVTSEPVAWPLSDTAGHRLGVQCVGEYAKLGSDPRFEYWNLETSASDWNGTYLPRVHRVTYADAVAEYGCATLKQTDFKLAKAELTNEFRWMAHLKSYVKDLSAPFGYNGTLPAFTAINTVTQNVKDALPIPEGVGGVNGFSLTESILGILGEIIGAVTTEGVTEYIAAGVDVTAAAFGIGGEFSGDAADSAATVFAQRNAIDAEGANIADRVAGRLQAISEGMEGMTAAIASDYDRLKDVGTHEGCVPAVYPPNVDPNCPIGWELTTQEVNDVQRAFTLSARRAAWGGLLSTAWPMALYTNSNPNSYNGTFVGPQEQISSIGCDYALPFNVTSPGFVRYDFRSDPGSSEGSNTKFIVITQANNHGASGYSFPPNSLFTNNQLFDAVNPENVTSGPLGMDEYQMLMDNYTYSGDPQPGPPPKGSGPTRENWLGC